MSQKTAYYTDADVKKQIDEVLHQNAVIFQNLGSNSTKADISAAKVLERKNLRAIKHLDPDFIENLIKED
jgi:hypothetical protein